MKPIEPFKKIKCNECEREVYFIQCNITEELLEHVTTTKGPEHCACGLLKKNISRMQLYKGDV